ncbi:MAG: pyridoxal phosphate-dependent aminotransferase, partial [Microbacteriaceae bacterium]|nr:pyridoxal phosphate-dependent aminotransferase [Microbacteriaceae bacterium]
MTPPAPTGPAAHPTPPPASSPLVRRMRGFGTTIFAEMSALAVAHGAINLGQGFPDSDGPAPVLDAAVDAIRGGRNQYPPGRGIPELRRAIADHQAHRYGLDYDPDAEVLVTAGATEALAAAVLALCEPGDEVLAFEPFYDAYAAEAALAQAEFVPVRLDAPHYRFDAARLEAAITPRSRLLILNSPHNPTGHVATRAELEAIAAVVARHGLLVVTDEVYEHLAFDGRAHLPFATLPGMRERTVTVSSAGKTFSTTGWKVGWACAPAPLLDAVATVKQWLTYVNGGPFQEAAAVGLRLPEREFVGFRERMQAQRDALVPALVDAGFDVHPAEGGYFVVADAAPLGVRDGAALCRRLPEAAGVAAIPMSAFHRDATGVESLVRFAFCKRPEVLVHLVGDDEQAVARDDRGDRLELGAGGDVP